MTSQKPNFLTLPTGERIAYHRQCVSNYHDKPPPVGVLFCGGFRSNMNGIKAMELEKFCRSKNVAFTRFDYRGHGESVVDDHFATLGLGDWIDDARAVLADCRQTQAGRPQILVGSSMGAWIALQLALIEPDAVAGILGIAAAPDFTVDLGNRLTREQRNELAAHDRVLLPSQYSDEPYPIGRHLLEDANQWLLLERGDVTEQDEMVRKDATIDIQCPVRLIHGQKDVDVSWKKSLRLLEAIATDNVHLTLLKSGDHRLSTSKDLDVICRVLEELIEIVRPLHF